MLKYCIQPVTAYQQNCTLLWCDQTAKAALVDPGGDTEILLALVKKTNVTLEKILLTHGHVDHVGAAGILSQRLGIPILGPQEEDDFLLRALPLQCTTFGLPCVEAFTPHQWLHHGDTLTLGKSHLEVLHCPGHTPGHVVYYSSEDQLAQVGDVLFHGSIGRTDFPRGNYQDLLISIRGNLFPLGDEVRFIPGHGPISTLGHERRTNPFVGDSVHGRGIGG